MTVWYQYGMSQTFKWTPSNRTAHSGVDLGVPWNTPVTAALSGTVIFAQCKPWGGQVDILGTWNGAAYVVTVLHLHQILIAQGSIVQQGQLLGYSGGDTRGPCPTQMPKYSNGPHVHLELTAGNLGPYHGAAPYKITASNYTVNPGPLLDALRSGSVFGAVAGAGQYLGALDPSLITPTTPVLDALFALPEATVTALDAIPGVDNLIYRLHEVETFPGWKSPDQVAPINNGTISFNALGQQINLTNPLDALNPGRIAYWFLGNLLGNFRAAFVRLLYATLGAMLFLALVIALAAAATEANVEEAEKVEQVVAPIVEAGAAAAA